MSKDNFFHGDMLIGILAIFASMDGQPVFSERQQFRQIWVWAVLLFADAIYFLPWLKRISRAIHSGAGFFTGIRTWSAVHLAIVLLVTLLFVVVRLDTEIREDGVHYRFLPFQWAYRRIGWDRINNAWVRQYHPIVEYGGWGIRFGMGRRGRAFNISGNKGLQLVYDNNKRFLIGTRKPGELEAALKALGRLSLPAHETV